MSRLCVIAGSGSDNNTVDAIDKTTASLLEGLSGKQTSSSSVLSIRNCSANLLQGSSDDQSSVSESELANLFLVFGNRYSTEQNLHQARTLLQAAYTISSQTSKEWSKLLISDIMVQLAYVLNKTGDVDGANQLARLHKQRFQISLANNEKGTPTPPLRYLHGKQ